MAIDNRPLITYRYIQILQMFIIFYHLFLSVLIKTSISQDMSATGWLPVADGMLALREILKQQRHALEKIRMKLHLSTEHRASKQMGDRVIQ